QITTTVKKAGEGFYTKHMVDFPYVCSSAFPHEDLPSLGHRIEYWRRNYLKPFITHLRAWAHAIHDKAPDSGTFDLWDLALEVVQGIKPLPIEDEWVDDEEEGADPSHGQAAELDPDDSAEEEAPPVEATKKASKKKATTKKGGKKKAAKKGAKKAAAKKKASKKWPRRPRANSCLTGALRRPGIHTQMSELERLTTPYPTFCGLLYNAKGACYTGIAKR
ncbi:MAG: hypothetical protein ACYTFT_10000, partial [Planctomycetota bacterium]